MSRIPGYNRPILGMFLAFFCIRPLPSASASVRPLPPATISTQNWAVWAVATCLGDRVMMSGGNIWSVWTMSRCLGDRMMEAGENIWEPNRP